MNETDVEVRPIDTPLLAGIGLGGALLGGLSSFGLLDGVLETAAWVVLAGGALIATLRRIPADAFRHSAFGLTLAGFFAGDVKVFFWDRFLAAHPQLVAAAQEQGEQTIPRVSVIFADTITGIIAGLVIGLIARQLSKNRNHSSSSNQPGGK